MTEPAQEESVPQEESPGTAAPATPAAPPVMEDLSDIPRPGILSKLNIMKMFRKDTPQNHVKEGRTLMENNNLALAAISFQKALELDDKCMEAYKGLGNSLMRKGGKANNEAALPHLKIASVLDPFDDHIYALSAKAYEKLGKLKEATLERKKMMIVKTLQMDSKNAIANNNMGILLLQQNQVNSAIGYFQKSIRTNPTYDIAYRNLAATYFKNSMVEEDPTKKEELRGQAKAFVGKALSISISVSSLLVNGRILVEEFRYEDALALVEEAEALDSTHKDVFGFKRIVLEKMNRTAEAQKAYESYDNLAKQTPGS